MRNYLVAALAVALLSTLAVACSGSDNGNAPKATGTTEATVTEEPADTPTTPPEADRRARTTLKRTGLWKRKATDASLDAWVDYVSIMRRLSRRNRVSLRDLDKALFAYDRWGRIRP